MQKKINSDRDRQDKDEIPITENNAKTIPILINKAMSKMSMKRNRANII